MLNQICIYSTLLTFFQLDRKAGPTYSRNCSSSKTANLIITLNMSPKYDIFILVRGLWNMIAAYLRLLSLCLCVCLELCEFLLPLGKIIEP